MVFSSLLFVYIFLPIVIVLYYLAKDEYRNYILLLASLVFYTYGEPRFVFVLLGTIVCNYFLAIMIDAFQSEKSHVARNILVLTIVINIGILFLFKYLDFSISVFNSIFGTRFPMVGIILPIGISFFTFQALSYVVDVYTGKVSVQKNLLFLALYISFFPQLIAGPIVRYSTIEKQISNRVCSLEKFSEGGKRFMIGFAKKVILANNLSEVSQNVFKLDATSANPLVLWMGSLCFSLQILYDFSGYSDMAIGLGKIFGFEFLENFNYPYISKSVTEFWRRWHMSLGQWFRDYVYIPLGGSQVSVRRHLLNMFVVWFLTGIWHGANYTFIIWGMGYFFILVIEKYLVKALLDNQLFGLIWRVITLLLINFGWVMFNSENWKVGVKFWLAMLGIYGNLPLIDPMLIGFMREYGFFVVCGVVLATPVVNNLRLRIRETKLDGVCAVISPFVYGFLFIWAVSFILLGSHNPFIYYNF